MLHSYVWVCYDAGMNDYISYKYKELGNAVLEACKSSWNQKGRRKELDRVQRIIEYRNSRDSLNDLLIAMMADLLKIDQRENTAASQRIRVNSIKFQKVAKQFRKLSVQIETKKVRKRDKVEK